MSVTFSWSGAPTWYSPYSSAVGRERTISNPFTDAKQAAADFLGVVSEISEQYGERILVLPSSDTNIMFLADNFEMFAPYIQVMGVRDFSAVRMDIVNKYECARRLSTHCPELVPLTRRCSSHDDIDKVVEEMVFPAIYKPATKDYGQSFYREHDGNKAIECEDADTLRKMLSREVDAGFDLVVQEKMEFDSPREEIPFYLYADAEGRITMAANGIKETIEPHPFGTAIVLRFAWVAELTALAEKVVSALDYRGVLMIEFLKDQKDDQWKVVEVNPRHWLFNGFYRRLDLNYTDQLLNDLYGTTSGSAMITATDATLARNHAHVDLVALAERWTREEKRLSFQGYMDKLGAIDGTLSDPFLDPVDPEPGLRRIQDLLMDQGWGAGNTDRVVSRLGA